MAAGLRRAEFSDPLTRQAEEEVELSLGLSIGGTKRNFDDCLNGSFPVVGSVWDSVDSNRKCRARREVKEEEEEVGLQSSDGMSEEIQTPNPGVALNPIPISVIPMYMPAAFRSGISRMVTCYAPLVAPDSDQSCLHPMPCRSLLPFAHPNLNHSNNSNPNIHHSPNPQYYPNPNHREIGGKRSAKIKRGPSSPVRSSSGPLRGRRSSSSSSETRSNSNLNAAVKAKEQANQEAMSKPKVESQAPAAAATVTKVAGSDAKVDEMPCVMTKGADGKTISGFLYRYNKREVSIVCVCHGSSFSPAGFVRHAGGMESSHPLRQIVVVPSSA